MPLANGPLHFVGHPPTGRLDPIRSEEASFTDRAGSGRERASGYLGAYPLLKIAWSRQFAGRKKERQVLRSARSCALGRQLLNALDQRGLARAGGTLDQAGHRVPLRLAGILKPTFVDAIGSAENIGYGLVPPDEDRGRASRAILAEPDQPRALLVVGHCHFARRRICPCPLNSVRIIRFAHTTGADARNRRRHAHGAHHHTDAGTAAVSALEKHAAMVAMAVAFRAAASYARRCAVAWPRRYRLEESS